MPRTLRAVACAFCAAFFALVCFSPVAVADDKPAVASDQRLSGPFTHANLTIFLVHGPGTLKVAHSKDEQIPLEEIETAAELLTLLVQDFCGVA